VLYERYQIIKRKITEILEKNIQPSLVNSSKWPGGGPEGEEVDEETMKGIVRLWKVDKERTAEILTRPLITRFRSLFDVPPLNRRDRPDWPIKHVKMELFGRAVETLEKGVEMMEITEIAEKMGEKLIDGLREYFRERLMEITEEEVSGYFSVFLTEFESEEKIFFSDFRSNWNNICTKLASGDVRLLEAKISADLTTGVVPLYELALPRVHAAGPILEAAYERLFLDPMKGVEKMIKDRWNAIPSLDRVEEISDRINDVESALREFGRFLKFPAILHALGRLHENMVDRVAEFLLSGGKDAVWGRKKHEEYLAALHDEYFARLNPNSRALLSDYLL
jgi:hypothetical protein